MTKILLDTNAYSNFMAGDQNVFDYIIEAEIIYFSTVVIGELFAGFYGGKRFTENKNELKVFLSKPGVQVLDVTIETSEIFGQIKNELSKNGKMIPLNDIWISSHAVETGSKLITYDGHFTNVPGIRIWESLNQRDI